MINENITKTNWAKLELEGNGMQPRCLQCNDWGAPDVPPSGYRLLRYPCCHCRSVVHVMWHTWWLLSLQLWLTQNFHYCPTSSKILPSSIHSCREPWWRSNCQFKSTAIYSACHRHFYENFQTFHMHQTIPGQTKRWIEPPTCVSQCVCVFVYVWLCVVGLVGECMHVCMFTYVRACVHTCTSVRVLWMIRSCNTLTSHMPSPCTVQLEIKLAHQKSNLGLHNAKKYVLQHSPRFQEQQEKNWKSVTKVQNEQFEVKQRTGWVNPKSFGLLLAKSFSYTNCQDGTRKPFIIFSSRCYRLDRLAWAGNPADLLEWRHISAIRRDQYSLVVFCQLRALKTVKEGDWVRKWNGSHHVHVVQDPATGLLRRCNR